MRAYAHATISSKAVSAAAKHVSSSVADGVAAGTEALGAEAAARFSVPSTMGRTSRTGLVAGVVVSLMKASHALRNSASNAPLASDCVQTTDGADRCNSSTTRLRIPRVEATVETAWVEVVDAPERPAIDPALDDTPRPVRSRIKARVALKSSA
eukprot:scaffold289103_cov35-Tisochrysis_lutea.AAC.2